MSGARGKIVVEPEIQVDTEYLGIDYPYELIHGRWSSRRVGFCFVGPEPPELCGLAWDAVRRAFHTWASVGVISIVERHDQRQAEIRVLWTLGPGADHNSIDPFYGTECAAVGYYPYSYYGDLAGDLHFNLAEPWTVERYSVGIDVQTVALHEIGHCLGLGHCRNQDSIMWPVYKQMQQTLTDDDRKELTRRYRDASP